MPTSSMRQAPGLTKLNFLKYLKFAANCCVIDFSAVCSERDLGRNICCLTSIKIRYAPVATCLEVLRVKLIGIPWRGAWERL